jgi:tetratricopeptide (TPR) repeat protein
MTATLHPMKLVDCYRLLGLRDGASYGAVKMAYRKLARQYHPDANPGDRAAQDKFVRIAQAYEFLVAELASHPGSAAALDGDLENALETGGLWTVKPKATQEQPSPAEGSAQADSAPAEAAQSLEQKLKQDIYSKLQVVLQAQRFPRAVALVEGLAQRLPDDPEVRQWQAITYQHWARQLCQTQQADKARVYLKKAIRVVPDNRKLTQELTSELGRLEAQG